MESKRLKPITYGGDGEGLYPQIVGGEKIRIELIRDYLASHGVNYKNAYISANTWIREFYNDTEGMDRKI